MLYSEMGEEHHGAETFWLPRELAQGLAEHLLEVLERLEGLIVQIFLPHFLPEMFHWVHFRTVGWLKDQADILRDLEVFGLVPARLIDLDHQKRVGKVFCNVR